MQTTGIEWTNVTWNPFVGCSINSAGCTNCYAMRQANRLEKLQSPSYRGTTRMVNGNPVWTGVVNRATHAAMNKPLQLREPSRIFVNSMSDFFHEKADDAWRVEALSVIKRTPQHHYQILTKLPENILPFMNRVGLARWPVNVWMGVTVERADFGWRLDELRKVPALVKFVSIEPLIGSVAGIDLTQIRWAIIGGESGPGARPMRLVWAQEARDICLKYGTLIFFKQWGMSENNPIYRQPEPRIPGTADVAGRKRVEILDPVGKGGSLLDGKSWKQYPVELQAQGTLL
jgi:protein gp37